MYFFGIPARRYLWKSIARAEDSRSGAARSAAFSVGPEAERIAACGSHLVAASVHQRRVVVMAESFAEVARFVLPFPEEDALTQLERRTDLVNPSPGVARLPTYIGGVACAGEHIFVLLDLPQACVYQVDLQGVIVGVYGGGTRVLGRHYWRLSVVLREGEVWLYTIATDADGSRGVAEITIEPTIMPPLAIAN